MICASLGQMSGASSRVESERSRRVISFNIVSGLNVFQYQDF
jgi:hypothetical protein